jgi:hypothetical protein
MLLYLKHAWDARIDAGLTSTEDLLDAIREGAVLRVRPKAMTVAVILAGLFPIMWGSGTGSEVMQRIAAPMVGGMITAPLLSMFVIPAVYLLLPVRPGVESNVVISPCDCTIAALEHSTPLMLAQNSSLFLHDFSSGIPGSNGRG